jgi:hypothetical protein
MNGQRDDYICTLLWLRLAIYGAVVTCDDDLMRDRQSQSFTLSYIFSGEMTCFIEYKILRKQIYTEIPPKVEYHLTPFGREFSDILSKVEELYSQQGR